MSIVLVIHFGSDDDYDVDVTDISHQSTGMYWVSRAKAMGLPYLEMLGALGVSRQNVKIVLEELSRLRAALVSGTPDDIITVPKLDLLINRLRELEHDPREWRGSV